MKRSEILGPWQYRRFMRWADYFFRIMPWLWFGGIGACLAVSVLKFDQRYPISIGLICALTVYPAIIGWFAINGFAIVWKFGLGAIQAARRRQRPDSLALAWAVSVLAAGIVFLGGALTLLSALLRRALTH